MKKPKLKTFETRMKLFNTQRLTPPAKKADADLQTVQHREWAFQVKERAGWQCEATTEAGTRCRHSRDRGDRMFADHIVERQDDPSKGLDLANGKCLCGQHHGLKTKAEARKRATTDFGIA